MDKATCSLNFMYCMEKFATAIYQIQKVGCKNNTIAERLAYAVDNEQQHALNLRNAIIELHKNPTRLAFLFQIAGRVMGYLSRCFGKRIALKIDVVIEKRAVKDYGYFLKTLELNEKTRLLIQNIITDEEIHIGNWQDSMKLLS